METNQGMRASDQTKKIGIYIKALAMPGGTKGTIENYQTGSRIDFLQLGYRPKFARTTTTGTYANESGNQRTPQPKLLVFK